MLTVLLGLSVIKAALIIAYFMHLKFERLSLFLTLFPMLIFCIVLMLIFLGDAYRIPHHEAAGMRRCLLMPAAVDRAGAPRRRAMRHVLPHGARAAGRARARVERRHPDSRRAAVPDSGGLRSVCVPSGRTGRIARA